MLKNPLKSIRVLYVEDEQIIRDEFLEILEDEVLSLHVATNGKEGLDIFKNNKIDIIISDIRMPVMDGLDMSREILNIEPQVPIILTSAFNDTKYLLESIKLGIDNYLIKPINLKELFNTLEKVSSNIINLKRLKKSEQLLNQYKDAVDKNAIVSKADKHGNITYVNAAFCKISGYTEKELIGKSHSIIRHPDTIQEIFKNLWSTILKKKEWHGKIKNLAKNGSFYIVDSTIIPVLNAENEIEEFISIRHDITREELYKDELKQTLQTSFQTLDEKEKFIHEYENALKENTLFCRTTIEGQITVASKALIQLLGLTANNIQGSSYLSLVDDESISTLDNEVRNEISKQKTWQGLIKHKGRNGKTYFLESSFIPILNTEGIAHEVLCFYTDITEQVHLNKEIVATQKEVISTMGAIGETRSKETGDHVKRVAEYSKLLALKYGITDKEAEELKMASPMHDIGKVGIPDNILNKPGKLTQDEFEIMKTHAELGYEMLKGSQQSLLKTAAIISREHHEKWDGSGYPRGLKADEIHLYGRITAIADVFDALGHDRVYKKAWPLEDILDLLKNGREKHFDPDLIDIFLSNIDDFLRIKDYFDNKKGNS
ncbi:PAS domain S-box protein [Sulfurimonas sp. MAG313]|nr:HD domain-containing phosphohydrolase [Sulfurimonas sp. MAG313]MDF1881152.1 PAS domain S-box protein [Sulfurimonas sp. MAG313]